LSAALYWVLGKPARLSYRAGVMVLEREHGASERIGLGALGSIIISIHAIQPSPNLQEATLHTMRAASAKLNLAVNLATLMGATLSRASTSATALITPPLGRYGRKPGA
jgi:hypothetical protein